jgi:hypothetical protein
MLAAAFITSAILASSASAGTYSVYTCVGPDGESLPNNAWSQSRSVPSHASAFTFGTTCPDLSVVTTPGTTLAAGEEAGYAFVAPAGTSITGYNVRRSVTVAFPASGTRPTLNAGLRRTLGADETYALECQATTTNCSIPASGTQSVGLSANGLQLGVECAQGTSCAGTGFNTLRTTLIESRVDLSDNSAPTIAATGGSLPGTLNVAINDIGGGIKSYWIAIDGVKKSVVDAGGSCGAVYTAPVPCPLDRITSYGLSVYGYSPGTHSAVVTASDAAGNVGTLAPITFTVPGGEVNSNGTPSVEYPSLKMRKSAISVKTSRSVSVSGTLRTTAGKAIGGATLEVVTSSLGGATEVPVRTASIKTAKDGGFSYKVKPNGALRITFLFRPTSGGASTATASTTLRQAISLSARRSKARLVRGASLTISGRLSGAGRAAAGTAVEIQVKNGKRWSTIDTVTASGSGSYKWKHRFTRVTRPTIFTFRSIVRPKQSWPWPSKSSSSVKVLVLG